MGSGNVEVIQYLVDTRALWLDAPKTKNLFFKASRALAFLAEDEQEAALKYYFVADAKMSLVSHLLKRWVVSKYANIPWWDVKLTRDEKTKPVYVDPATGKQPVAFNVSHQAGIVALVAVAGYDGKVDVGTDIVCTSERRARDREVINTEGWGSFVDLHSDVFGRSEAGYLKSDLSSALRDLPPLARVDEIIDSKLRAFYALWCLREAYVKMTGDALLAPWLKDLEFKNFRAPHPSQEFEQRPDEEVAEKQEIIKDHEILFHGNKVDDVNICLRSLGPAYMTCSAIRTPDRKEDALSWDLGPYQFLRIDQILSDAEDRLAD
ncbi:4'-phosphopantetheinyl transferase [Daldinia sp. FL1419]|nr:4'-phosphopantetheinyl transferase [Daldinia sp. FL1419]